MAVMSHTAESLDAIAKELVSLAQRLQAVKKSMTLAGIDSIRVDNEKDRLKAIKAIDDWIVEADVAFTTTKIRLSRNN